jgi:dienelactone hydrolase
MEDMEFERRFDIGLLTKRLVGATEWLEAHHAPFKGCIGFFGASTGAAAALRAAALLPQVKAVVSRGGRPDLAGDALGKVAAPTLLIVGAMDEDVVLLNEVAYEKLQCQKRMKIVLGATHLFEEPGKLDEVMALAEDWFEQWMKE